MTVGLAWDPTEIPTSPLADVSLLAMLDAEASRYIRSLTRGGLRAAHDRHVATEPGAHATLLELVCRRSHDELAELERWWETSAARCIASVDPESAPVLKPVQFVVAKDPQGRPYSVRLVVEQVQPELELKLLQWGLAEALVEASESGLSVEGAKLAGDSDGRLWVSVAPLSPADFADGEQLNHARIEALDEEIERMNAKLDRKREFPTTLRLGLATKVPYRVTASMSVEEACAMLAVEPTVPSRSPFRFQTESEMLHGWKS